MQLISVFFLMILGLTLVVYSEKSGDDSQNFSY